MSVTPSFFRLLRARPLVGRLFAEEDGEIGKQRKAILSYALWQELYAGDRSVIGKDIRIYGNPYTIVGVLPRDFSFLDPRVRVYRPLAFTPEQKSDDGRHNNSWEMIGRLKPGATRGTGPGPARRHQRRQHVAASAFQGDPHQRQVLHPRVAAPG